MRANNPIAFRPGPVTFWTVLVYVALLVPLVYIHESVPPAPSSPTPIPGINLTEAWHDLTTITKHYHPYNSVDNERVGDYILQRIEEILNRNRIDWTKETAGGIKWGKTIAQNDADEATQTSATVRRSGSPSVTVFDDNTSNVTWASASSVLSFGNAGYYEGTNKLVYIRGTEDASGEWWKSQNTDVRLIGRGGVLVNAHYDSVSSGYGATDDGMGVVSVLQLLNFFTTPGNQPKRGIVLLFNNNEEDGLLGAKAFAYSPLFSFPTTFVNLEGAGAGGRAILFRSSDKEITRAYSKGPHPFGSVLASDGFEMGLIRSQTDYVIFNGVFGQRGLDIAFYKPRPRYHTNQDDTRHTSRDSLWHMLANALPAVHSLSHNIGETFAAPRTDGDRSKVPSGRASDGVWFDMFGQGFAIFGLRGLFAWALTLLILSPLVLVMITYILVRKDKYYLFSGKVNVHGQGSEDPVSIGGFRGLLRFPIAFIIATAVTFASALLIRKVNPLIIYSSAYGVWAMMLSLFYVAFWTIMKGSSAVRPSALQRVYAHFWLFILSWILLVAVAVFVDRFRIAAFFPFAFLHSSVFVATVISMVDLFALPPKRDYARRAHDDHQTRDQINEVPHSDALIAPAPHEVASSHAEDDEEEEAEEPTETTPLRSGEAGHERITFRRSLSATNNIIKKVKQHEPFEKEQAWSGSLWSWTWCLQFLLLGPINIILFGQIALLLTSATQNIRGDGGSDIVPYMAIAGLSVFLLIPLSPFIHRVNYIFPMLLFVIFIGTLIYNLLAFPFSADDRYKVYFQQDVQVEDGTSVVKITGIEEYVRLIIDQLPSSSGQKIECQGKNDDLFVECSYDGSSVLPRVTDKLWEDQSGSTKHRFESLISVNVTKPGKTEGKATFSIDAENTKACTLKFDRPISTFSIDNGAGIDSRFGEYPDKGVESISLYRRKFSGAWVVSVEWKDEDSKEPSTELDLEGSADDRGSELRARSKLGGTVECQWDDANLPGTIPAYDECLQYSPDWAAFTKQRQGLVRGVKKYSI